MSAEDIREIEQEMVKFNEIIDSAAEHLDAAISELAKAPLDGHMSGLGSQLNLHFDYLHFMRDWLVNAKFEDIAQMAEDTERYS